MRFADDALKIGVNLRIEQRNLESILIASSYKYAPSREPQDNDAALKQVEAKIAALPDEVATK